MSPHLGRLAGLSAGYLGAVLLGRVLDAAQRQVADREQLVASYEAWIAAGGPGRDRDCSAAEQSTRDGSGR
jgi:uncharacterized protein YecT (DUF1311 family)